MSFDVLSKLEWVNVLLAKRKSYYIYSNIQSANNSASKCKNYTLEEQAIINILKNNPTITQEEISKEINKSLRTVKSHMSDMKEKGFLFILSNCLTLLEIRHCYF